MASLRRATLASFTKASRRTGVSTLGLFGVLAIAALALGGTAAWWWKSGGTGDADDALVYTTSRGEFVLDVTERGDLESANNVDIRCEVSGRSGHGVKILQIVPEGTRVEKGDFLLRLDSAELELELIQQQIEITNKEAVQQEAQNMHEAAEIALNEYQYGTFVQEKKEIEIEKFKAEENWTLADQYLEYSKRAYAKGVISKQQLDADELKRDTAKKEMEMAAKKLEVLEDYTFKKMMKELESEVKTTGAKANAAQADLDYEKKKLQDLEEELKKCVIYSPAAGVVKYATRSGGRFGSDEDVVEEGREVYERQLLLQLPDANQMQVRLFVNESVVNRIGEGMPAKIKMIGLRDDVLSGSVTNVAQYSERENWRRGGVKEFAVLVRIDTPDPSLRTGMSAHVTIECQRLPDVLKIPVQALIVHGPDHYCVVLAGAQPELRKVTPGVTNDKFVVISAGLKEGEVVSMNPRAYLEELELPKLAEEVGRQASGKEGPEDQLEDSDQRSGETEFRQPGPRRPGPSGSNGQGADRQRGGPPSVDSSPSSIGPRGADGPPRGNRRRGGGGRPPAVSGEDPPRSQSGRQNRQSETRNSKPGTETPPNSEPGTRNSELASPAGHSKPGTRNPAPATTP